MKLMQLILFCNLFLSACESTCCRHKQIMCNCSLELGS